MKEYAAVTSTTFPAKFTHTKTTRGMKYATVLYTGACTRIRIRYPFALTKKQRGLLMAEGTTVVTEVEV